MQAVTILKSVQADCRVVTTRPGNFFLGCFRTRRLSPENGREISAVWWAANCLPWQQAMDDDWLHVNCGRCGRAVVMRIDDLRDRRTVECARVPGEREARGQRGAIPDGSEPLTPPAAVSTSAYAARI